jgi:hypothetical protein
VKNLLERLHDLHLMNTLGKQVAWLAVIFAGGLLYFRSQQKPVVEAPPVHQPLGGPHCVLMAEEARRELREVVERIRGGGLDETSFRPLATKVEAALDEAAFECSVARSDAERAALEAVRGALQKMRGAAAGLSPSATVEVLDAVTGTVLPEVGKTLADVRPALSGAP